MAIEIPPGQYRTTYETFAKRFWARVAIAGPDDCWEWQSTRYKQTQYGDIRWPLHWVREGLVPCLRTTAHRVALILATDADPFTKLHVLHSCDNRPCCNPKHLRFGTNTENIQDMVSRGRWGTRAMPRGVQHQNAKLDDDKVREIRRRYAEGGLTYVQLAREYGVSKATISHVMLGIVWSHVA